MREYSIGKRLIEGYLHQPYSWFLNRHSADIGKVLLSEVGQMVSGGLRPLIELIANFAVALALLILLILTDPKLSLVVGFFIVGAYGLIYKLTRAYLQRIGKERLKSNENRFTAVMESPLEQRKRLKSVDLNNPISIVFGTSSYFFKAPSKC